nr:hypothetical protein [uncultured Lichenicoccus sp.]
MFHARTLDAPGLTDASASPNLDQARIRDLDVIRRGALIGVMWMNIYAITMWLVPASEREHWSSAPLDHLVAFGSDWLIAGKAQTLFGILFGFGFAVFSARAAARDHDAVRLYARRLLFLLALGLLHYGLVWRGDILHDYAVAGLLLLLTRGFSDRSLLVLAVGCGVVAPPLVDLAFVSHHARGCCGRASTRRWAARSMRCPRSAGPRSLGRPRGLRSVRRARRDQAHTRRTPP